MSKKMSIGVRIKKLREQKNISQKELAKAIGITQPSLSHLENSQGASSKKILEISRALNCSPEYLLYGNDEGQNTLLALDLYDDNSALSSEDIIVSQFKMTSNLHIGNVKINNTSINIRLNKKMLSALNINPDNACYLVISGNSMQPTMPDGAIIAIDMDDKEVKDGDIYAFVHEEQLFVQKLYNEAGKKIRITSFNSQEHPNYSVHSNEIEIIGRAFWYSATI